MMESMLMALAEPMTHDFMVRALVMSAGIGAVCAIFSCFLILKGWALMGDAVSHAVLPGIAGAYVLGLPMAAGAFAAGLFCATAIGFIKNRSRVKEDAVMGIVFSGMFALGLVMLTLIQTDVHLLHVLFGDVLGITARDMMEAGLIAAVVSGLILIKRRDILLYCFDPAHTHVMGMNVRLMRIGLMVLLALTIVAALKAVGVILVVAMLIAPGAVGFLCTRRFDHMMLVAVGVAVASCVAGTYLSYYLDAATAPLIVLIQAVVFFTVLGVRGGLKQENTHGGT